jgi:hypothetical protein
MSLWNEVVSVLFCVIISILMQSDWFFMVFGLCRLWRESRVHRTSLSSLHIISILNRGILFKTPIIIGDLLHKISIYNGNIYMLFC